MPAVTKTQLRQAENELIEAVGDHVNALTYRMVLTPHESYVVTMYHQVMDLRLQREHAAAANYRNTSIAAAKMMEPKVGSLRRRILVIIAAQHRRGFIGCTDEALEGRTRRGHSTVSAQRNHLFNVGWLKPSGEYRDTVSGQPAIVWTLTEAAIERLPDLLEDGNGTTEDQSS